MLTLNFTGSWHAISILTRVKGENPFIDQWSSQGTRLTPLKPKNSVEKMMLFSIAI